MSRKKEQEMPQCIVPSDMDEKYRRQLPRIVDDIVESCAKKLCFKHVDAAPIPSKESVIEIIDIVRDILYPGYFGQQEIDLYGLPYHVGTEVTALFERLSRQISRSIIHECRRYNQLCSQCIDRGQKEATNFLIKIPKLQQILALDVRAAFHGDPAAKSHDEIIFSYPGFLAITIYRVAHELHLQGVPLIPRIMTEYAHSVTGIDIHPGAKIRERFFIDHGTGVVIGETSVIGNNVIIYQGVTLGALSFPKDEQGKLIRGTKRHPTIEDDVVVYANATILGDVVIGARSVIGGNVWITHSVPPDTKVILKDPGLIYKCIDKEKNPQVGAE